MDGMPYKFGFTRCHSIDRQEEEEEETGENGKAFGSSSLQNLDVSREIADR